SPLVRSAGARSAGVRPNWSWARATTRARLGPAAEFALVGPRSVPPAVGAGTERIPPPGPAARAGRLPSAVPVRGKPADSPARRLDRTAPPGPLHTGPAPTAGANDSPDAVAPLPSLRQLPGLTPRLPAGAPPGPGR